MGPFNFMSQGDRRRCSAPDILRFIALNGIATVMGYEVVTQFLFIRYLYTYYISFVEYILSPKIFAVFRI